MTSTQVGFRVCAISPSGWSEWVTQLLLIPYLALYILQYIYIGIVLVSPKILHAACNILALVLAYYSIWRVERLIAWKRPFDFASACSGPAGFYDDMLNLYGAPDPNFITGFALAIAICYIEYKVYQKALPWMFVLSSSALLVAVVVGDFVLARVTIAQFFANIACTIVFTLALILLIHTFFDVFPHYAQSDGVVQSFWPTSLVQKQNTKKP